MQATTCWICICTVFKVKHRGSLHQLHLHCYILYVLIGYPPAALFGFCVALISYMIVSVIKTALIAIYGAKFIDE